MLSVTRDMVSFDELRNLQDTIIKIAFKVDELQGVSMNFSLKFYVLILCGCSLLQVLLSRLFVFAGSQEQCRHNK